MKKLILLTAAAVTALSAVAHAQDASFWYRHPVAGIVVGGASTPANRPPAITGAAGSLTADPGTSVNPFQLAAVSDPDAGDVLTATLTIADPAAGSVTNNGGLAPQGEGTYELAGTPEVITTALRNFIFQTAVGRLPPGGTEDILFSLQVSDEAEASVSSVVTLTVNELPNGAPSIAGVASTSSHDATAGASPFPLVTLSDPEDDLVTVTVTLGDPAAGSLTTLAGFTDAGGGLYTFIGTPADATNAMRGLVFTLTPGRLTPGASETVQISVNVEDAFGLSATATASLEFSAAPNGPPIIAGVPSGLAVEVGNTINPFAVISVSDPEDDAVTLTITIDDSDKGDLSSLGDFVKAGSTYWLSAPPGELTAALQALVFTPAEGRLAPAASEGVQFSIIAQDAYDLSAPSTVSITVTAPSNDPPVIAGAPSGLAMEVGDTITPFASMSVSDPENDTVTLAVTIDVSAKGSFSSLGGFVRSGSTYTISALPGAATTALKGLVFTPATGRLEPEESETVNFTLTAEDAYGSGSSTVSLTVTAPAPEIPPDSCGGATVVGTVCSDGAIYAGMLSGQKIYAAPSDLPRLMQKTSFPAATYASSTTDGVANTNVMLANGAANHPAAAACRAMGSEWYLPAIEEVRLFYNNIRSHGFYIFTGTTGFYWSSTSQQNLSFYMGHQGTTSPTSDRLVRCARRG